MSSSFRKDIFHNDFSVYVSSEPVSLEPSTKSSTKNKEGYSQLYTDISNILIKYDSINDNIKTYNSKKIELTNQRNSDFKNEDLEFTNTVKTFQDGAEEDVQIMLVHQYNMYIAGLITTSTLILFAILLARE
jgi:hypothetical protein